MTGVRSSVGTPPSRIVVKVCALDGGTASEKSASTASAAMGRSLRIRAGFPRLRRFVDLKISGIHPFFVRIDVNAFRIAAGSIERDALQQLEINRTRLLEPIARAAGYRDHLFGSEFRDQHVA